MKLNPLLVAALEPKAAPYKLADGQGLYVHVFPNGAKCWRQKYRFGGKEKTLTHGIYPEVSLEEARERRDEARKQLAQGIDPSEQVKLDKAQERDEQARQLVATRFTLDSDGALAVRLGNRCFTLSPAETQELRTFLDATRAVTPRN